MFSSPVMTPWLQIGQGTYYGADITLKAWVPGERIVIGNYCSIGERVTIFTGGMRRTDTAALYPFDVQQAYRTTAPTTVGNDVWIGYGATLFRGARVGDGAIVGTGAVVASDVPPFAVVVGNPARVIRYRFAPEICVRLQRIGWWHWPEAEIIARRDWFYRSIEEFVEKFDPSSVHEQDEREHG